MFNTSLFYLLSSFGLTSGLMVIFAENPVHSALFLILVFCNTSCLLLLIEAEFLALIFIIVYVGAIAVLFLFVIMMLNVKLSELNESVSRYLPLGGVLAIIFLLEISLVLGSDLAATFSINHFSPILNEIFQISSFCPSWALMIEASESIELFGQVIYTNFVSLFLMSSLILLVSMIGAIVLTLHKRVNVKKQDIFKQVSANFGSVIVSYG
jgi:NADH:ubiquinone oxidoreductase subunit 6 (subunit J)